MAKQWPGQADTRVVKKHRKRKHTQRQLKFRKPFTDKQQAGSKTSHNDTCRETRSGSRECQEVSERHWIAIRGVTMWYRAFELENKHQPA